MMCYRDFLEASYEHLVRMSDGLKDPCRTEHSLEMDKLEVMIIRTIMEVMKELRE
jgi:hypothetical protein